MKLRYLLLAGNLLLAGPNLTQLPAKQWDRTRQAGGYIAPAQVCAPPAGGSVLGGVVSADIADDKSEPNRGNSLHTDYWVVKLAPTVLASHPSSSVFPNPTRGAFTAELPADAPRTGLQVALVNVLGSVVYQQAPPAATQLKVPAGAVPPGLYWVHLRGPRGYLAIHRVILS